MLAIEQIMEEAFSTAQNKGFHEEDFEVGRAIALMHSELSEALEDWRNGRSLNKILVDDNGKPEGFPIEMADTIIRICEVSKRNGIPLAQAIRVKLDYNYTRPYRHGNKKA